MYERTKQENGRFIGGCVFDVSKKSQHINKRLHRDGVGQMIVSLLLLTPQSHCAYLTSPAQFVRRTK